MNADLKALQDVASAVAMGDYITDITPIKEDGVEVGYKITFAVHGVVTVYHGRDRENAADAPVLGLKQDTDGEYYWTLDGEWILDDKGNKVAASASGVTPKLKIENEKWYVSYDEGKTWEEMGNAVAEAPACLFKSLVLTEDALLIELADGLVLTVPMTPPFTITTGEIVDSLMKLGDEVEIPYSVDGAAGDVIVFAVSNSWMFEAKVVEESATEGKLLIRQVGSVEEEKNVKIGLFAVNESGVTVSRVFDVYSGVLVMKDGGGWYEVGSEATQLSVTLLSNLDYEVTTDADWISFAQTKAVVEGTLVFDIAENTTPNRRLGHVRITSGLHLIDLWINQAAVDNVFRVTLEAPVDASYEIAVIDLTTLVSDNGVSIKDALGYGSWEELRYAIGSYDEMVNMFSMPVGVFGYNLYYDGFYVDPYNTNGAGYWLTADGSITSWGTDEARCYWELYPYDWDEHFIMRTGVMPDRLAVGDVYRFGVLFQKHATGDRARIEVTINVVDAMEYPAEGNYLLVETSDMVEAIWDSQLWITFDDVFEEGDYWEVSMAVKADKEATISTQTHNSPGNYIHWDSIGSVPFKTRWTNYSASGIVTSEMVGGNALAFMLNQFEFANKYYFDDVSFKVNGVEQIVNGSFDDPYVNENFLMQQYGKNNGNIVPATIVNTNSSLPGYSLTMTNTEVQESNWMTQCWYKLSEPLKADTQYEFTCMAKATSKYDWCSIFLQSEDGSVQNFNHGMSFFEEWTHTTIIFNSDSDLYNKLTFNFGDFAGTLYLDNVSLKEVGSDIELIANGDFEKGMTDGWNSWTNLPELGEGYPGASSQPQESNVLWEGEMIVDDWSSQYALSDAGTELMEAGAQAGQVVNFYMEPLEDMWQLEIFEGHWGSKYLSVCSIGMGNPESTEYDLAANGGKIKLVLTQEILDAAFTQQWWGGTFVLNGDNVRVTKITLSAD